MIESLFFTHLPVFMLIISFSAYVSVCTRAHVCIEAVTFFVIQLWSTTERCDHICLVWVALKSCTSLSISVRRSLTWAYKTTLWANIILSVFCENSGLCVSCGTCICLFGSFFSCFYFRRSLIRFFFFTPLSMRGSICVREGCVYEPEYSA